MEFGSREELQEERKKLDGKFKNSLPSYLIDFFDEKELEFISEEKNRLQDEDKKSNRSLKEKEEEFWKNHKTEIVKIQRRNPKGTEIHYPEPLRATERLDEETEKIDSRLVVDACSIRLDAFATRYFPHYLKKPNSEFHEFLYKILSEEIDTRMRWAIAAPRSNAKSSIVSGIFPIWCICYNKKKFIILLSDTAGQAEDFLSDIKRELEDNVMLQRDFPYACGKGEVWRSDEIIARNNVKIKALGSGNKIRGRKFGTDRPSLIICHKKGTRISYYNKWISIEQHPTATERIDVGLEIEIWGLPFRETVTRDHRYWIKRIWGKTTSYPVRREVEETSASWEKADTLDSRCFIGYKIDYEVREPQAIDHYYSKILRRDNIGRILPGNTPMSFIKKVPREFYDRDFWWLVGLWWGDGHLSGRYGIGVTISDNDIFERIRNILEKYGRRYSIAQKVGCFQIVFSWVVLNRWLRSWRKGAARKEPPWWVEKLPIEYQKELIKGYLDADGHFDLQSKQVRLTSIHLEGLLSVRRILARLGIPCSIRRGIGPRIEKFKNRYSRAQQKYDLRFRHNAHLLGYNINNQDRYYFTRNFIKDGYLWSKVRSIREIDSAVFVPVRTEDRSYITHFGLSHNCDDIENSEMVRSEAQRTSMRYNWFNKDVLYAGQENTDYLVVGTILGRYALLTALLDPNEYPDWKSKRFEAVKEFSLSPLWDKWARLYKDHFDPEREMTALRFYEDHKEEMLKGTKILWPEGDPYYNLMIDRLRDPRGFSSEKQNKAIDPTAVYVTKEDLHWENFKSVDIARVLDKATYYGAIDPSLGKKTKEGDNSVIITLARDIRTGLLFVEEINIKRRSVDEQIDDILKAHEHYDYKSFGVETNAFQYVIADSLRKRSRLERTYIPIKEVTQYQDKRMRIEGIVPFLRDHTIVFDSHKYRYDPQYYAGVEELCSYTGLGDEQDDAPDALSTAFEIAKKPKFKLLTRQARGRR